MFTSVGVAASSGVVAALIVGVSILPTMLVQWRGQKWRGALANNNDDVAEKGTSAKV
jgi:hypothetical protein